MAILTRLFQSNQKTIPRTAARALLAFRFGPEDVQRMNELAECARQGRLSRDQREEIESYERIGHLLALFQCRARESMGKRTPRRGR